MKLWIESGELKSDDDVGRFYWLSTGHDLYTYSVVGVLKAFVQHERFESEGCFRLPTDQEKWMWDKHRRFDADEVLAGEGWKPLDVLAGRGT